MTAATFMALFMGTAAAISNYQISRSLRFRNAATAFLSRTPVAGNRTTWTYSCWVKLTNLSVANGMRLLSVGVDGAGGTNQQNLSVNANGVVDFTQFDGTTTNVGGFTTSALVRDTAAHCHLVFTWDTSNVTGADRLRIYLNGVRMIGTMTAIPALNLNSLINSATPNNIGRHGSGQSYFDGLMSEIYFIDGQALDPTPFGAVDAVSGVWTPKAYGGTYGANGFHLDFSDNSAVTAAAIGADRSGNGNNWTPTAISITAGTTNDSLTDSPTNFGSDTGVGGEVRGNYPTFSPLNPGVTQTLSEGNLKVAHGSAGVSSVGFSMRDAKWYWEVTIVSIGNIPFPGIAPVDTVMATFSMNATDSVGYRQDNGNKRIAGVDSAYGAAYAANDVIGLALDLVGNTLTFYKNGVSQGAIAITNREYIPVIYSGGASVSSFYLNGGQRPFANAAPAGYKALCTQNMTTPTVVKSNTAFDTNLRTGTGAAAIVAGKAFAPDMIWIKDRSIVSNHTLWDSVRGANARLIPNLENAEDAGGGAGVVSVFNSDGFSVDGGTQVNTTGDAIVDWFWKKNAAAGIDIVSDTGDGTTNRAIAHSLGVAPSMIIRKCRTTGATNWSVWHTSLASAQSAMFLELSNAQGVGNTPWGTTSANAANFFVTLNTGSHSNAVGNTYITYLFASVAGFSRFGSYTGTAVADGPFVYCGFRPRWIMIKRADVANDWTILDTARSPFNLSGGMSYLAADVTQAELSTLNFDILSNGFKIRDTTAYANAVGGTYIYAAFAEAPFQNARAR